MSDSSCIGADFFQDDEDDSPILPPSLSWRGDPSKTHSDWTIIIATSDNESKVETTYHVHKVILSVGPRSSTYFATLFASHHFKEHSAGEGGISRIDLEKDDAAVFFIMLDYIYNDALEATTENAVALRSLARYFQCHALLKSVNAFIQGDLSITTAPQYLVQAWQRSDQKVKSSAQQLLLSHFEALDEHALDVLPIPLFTEIWSSVKSDNDARSSRMVYYYFQAHPQARTATLLSDFTSSINHIDVSVVSGFLELVAQLNPLTEDADAWLALDGLCKKCASCLVQDWRLFDTELCVRKFLNPSLEGDFRGTGRIAVRLQSRCIQNAKADYTALLEKFQKLQASEKRLVTRIEAQQECISSLETNVRYKDLEIAGLQIGLDRHKQRAAMQVEAKQTRVQELESRVADLKQQLVAANKEIANLKSTPPTKKRGGWTT